MFHVKQQSVHISHFSKSLILLNICQCPQSFPQLTVVCGGLAAKKRPNQRQDRGAGIALSTRQTHIPSVERPPQETNPESMSAPQGPVVLYDGTCGFCDRVVQFVLKHDREGVFTFAALQGETATALRQQHPSIPHEVETMVLLHGGNVFLRSRAAFEMAALLPQPWRSLRVLRWLPRWLTDLGYKLVARVRYRMFGQHDVCPIPEPAIRHRFLP